MSAKSERESIELIVWSVVAVPGTTTVDGEVLLWEVEARAGDRRLTFSIGGDQIEAYRPGTKGTSTTGRIRCSDRSQELAGRVTWGYLHACDSRGMVRGIGGRRVPGEGPAAFSRPCSAGVLKGLRWRLVADAFSLKECSWT